MTRRRQRRSNGLPLLSFGPPLLAMAAWGKLHEPFKDQGLLALLVLGVIAGLMVPAVLLSLEDLPKLLLPARWRAAYRRGAAREDQRSSYIPLYLRQVVLAIDGRQCAWCHSTDRLQIDHIRPWAAGGLAVLWNLMTLCGTCNKVKSNYWPGGYYRAFVGFDNIAEARDILRCERWRRLSPARWVRAGFALAV
jgi:hypothetical protein